MSSPLPAHTSFPAAQVLPRSARWFLVLGAISACTSVVFSAAFAHLPVFAVGTPPANTGKCAKAALNTTLVQALIAPKTKNHRAVRGQIWATGKDV